MKLEKKVIFKETDKCLILGPGRTGSKVIIEFLRNIYRCYGYAAFYRAPNVVADTILPLLEHSHNVADIEKEYTHYILSSRDIVDSTLSWCIQPHLGLWHIYSGIEINLSEIVRPFHLSPELFLDTYNRIKNFYDEVYQKLPSNTLIIDYELFQDDPSILLDIFNPDIRPELDYFPIKNPGTHEEWIINWKEIMTIINTLQRKP